MSNLECIVNEERLLEMLVDADNGQERRLIRERLREVKHQKYVSSLSNEVHKRNEVLPINSNLEQLNHWPISKRHTWTSASPSPVLYVNLQRKVTSVKEKLLEWCRQNTKEYQHVNITNFTTSWQDGMAFCALVHRFSPSSFDFNQLHHGQSLTNLNLAFNCAEELGVTRLLDAEDIAERPDWKCVFMYVESLYRRFANPRTFTQQVSLHDDARSNNRLS